MPVGRENSSTNPKRISLEQSEMRWGVMNIRIAGGQFSTNESMLESID